MIEDQGGLTPEQQAAIRELALQTLVAFRDGGSVAAPTPTGADLDGSSSSWPAACRSTSTCR